MKKIIIASLLVALLIFNFAPNVQAKEDYELKWIKGLDNIGTGSQSDLLFEIKPIDDGNLAYLSIFGKIKKIDSNGNVLLNKSLVKPGDYLYYFSFEQTSDGGFIFCGQYQEDYHDNTKARLLKTDGQGNEIWNKTYDSSYGLFRRIIRADNGFVILMHSGNKIMYIDEQGNELQNYTIGYENTYYQCLGFKDAPDEGFIHFYRGLVSSNNPLCLTKLSEKGEIIWSGSYIEGKSFAEMSTFDKIDAGGYAIFMNYNREDGTGSPAIMFIDEVGNKIKTKDMNWLGPVNCGIQTDDGGFLLTGGYIENVQNPEYDVIVAKTDSNGNELWNITFGGDEQDEGYFIVEGENKDYYIIGGGCQSEIDSDDKSDTFIAKISSDSASANGGGQSNTGDNDSKGTPGFEFVFLIIAIAFVFYNRKKDR